MQKEDDESAAGNIVTIVTSTGDTTSTDRSSPATASSLETEGDGPTADQRNIAGGGLAPASPDLCRAKSAPNQSTNRLPVRTHDSMLLRSECRSTEDMMMGTKHCEHDLDDYFSAMDPSQCHFYDFGIQDFLAMRRHPNVDITHEDEEVQHGDYNCGLNVSPGPYLSDSDLSVTSIELSPAQVLWEKKLLEEASILKNCLLKCGKRQNNWSDEAGRGRLRGLRRRATDLCFGQRSKNVVRKVLSRPLSVTEIGLPDDCVTSNRQSLDIADNSDNGGDLSSPEQDPEPAS